MRIGIDFDNTIAGYDRLFATLAAAAGLAPPAGIVDESRKALRDRLRADGEAGEVAWQRLQAEAYGPRMDEAELFDGLLDFLATAGTQGAELYVISHKTRYARRDRDNRWDMRAAALAWMEARGLFAYGGLDRMTVFFEDTREAKVARIAALGCTHFIDDLEEVFAHPAFPAGTAGYLLAPDGRASPKTAGCRVQALPSWRAIHAHLLGEPA